MTLPAAFTGPTEDQAQRLADQGEQTLAELDAVVDLFDDPFSADGFRAAVAAIRDLYADAGPATAASLLTGWLESQADEER